MTSVLITGATGFVGSHLVRACLSRGDRVTVLARPGSATRRLTEVLPEITLVRAESSDVTGLCDVLKAARPEVVFHLGARTRYRSEAHLEDLCGSVTDNLAPLLALLSAASIVPPRAFVRAGTIAEYGDVALPYREELREAPRNAYGMSMLAGTQYMRMAQARLPFAAVTARLALVYGPGQNKDFLIPQLISACRTGAPLTIRRPRDRRDLLHVDDAVAGLLRLAERPDAAAPVVNIASGRAERMGDVARAVLRATGADPACLTLLPQDVPSEDLVCDASRAETLLGWRAELSLRAGLARTLAASQDASPFPLTQKTAPLTACAPLPRHSTRPS